MQTEVIAEESSPLVQIGLRQVRFCSTRKLEVADKNFGLLIKIISCIGKYGGLKTAYQAIFGLYARIFELNFACDNRYTHVILLPVGPQQSLLILI